MRHSMALDLEGQAYIWGENQCGQLGTGDLKNQSSP